MEKEKLRALAERMASEARAYNSLTREKSNTSFEIGRLEGIMDAAFLLDLHTSIKFDNSDNYITHVSVEGITVIL